jgi:hypothetical protein
MIAGMIAIKRSRTFSGIIISLEGTQTTSELEKLADVVSARSYSGVRFRILFDWSKLKDWQFGVRKCSEVWVNFARSAERVAIVHHHCWNRHAAWIGAALRLGNAEVRSYRVEDIQEAQDWLKSGKDGAQPRRRRRGSP